MATLPKILLLTLAVALAGCATIANHEHANALQQAQADDQACVAQGWRYPTPRYVTCRMQIDDQRQYHNWMNLQMLQRTQFLHPGQPPGPPVQESYRPLSPDTYACNYVTEHAKDYILCSETTGI